MRVSSSRGILRIIAQPTPCSDLPRIRRPACHPARLSSKRVVLCLSQMKDDDDVGRDNREQYESHHSHGGAVCKMLK